MKSIVSNVLAGLIIASICANVAVWKNFGERLARIEAKLEIIEPHKYAKSSARSNFSE